MVKSQMSKEAATVALLFPQGMNLQSSSDTAASAAIHANIPSRTPATGEMRIIIANIFLSSIKRGGQPYGCPPVANQPLRFQQGISPISNSAAIRNPHLSAEVATLGFENVWLLLFWHM